MLPLLYVGWLTEKCVWLEGVACVPDAEKAEVVEADIVFVNSVVASTTPVTETMPPIAAAHVGAAVTVANNTPIKVETADMHDDDAMQALTHVREVCKNITGVSA